MFESMKALTAGISFLTVWNWAFEPQVQSIRIIPGFLQSFPPIFYGCPQQVTHEFVERFALVAGELPTFFEKVIV